MRPAEILVEMLLDEAGWLNKAGQLVKGAAKGAYNLASRAAQGTFYAANQKSIPKPVKAGPKLPKATRIPVTKRPVTDIAVVYGPNLPQEGYYMTGGDYAELLGKLKKGMQMKLGNRAVGKDDASIINSWIVNGYQIFRRDGAGKLFYYGEKPRALDQRTADALGAQPTQHMLATTRAGSAGSMEYPTIS